MNICIFQFISFFCKLFLLPDQVGSYTYIGYKFIAHIIQHFHNPRVSVQTKDFMRFLSFIKLDNMLAAQNNG